MTARIAFLLLSAALLPACGGDLRVEPPASTGRGAGVRAVEIAGGLDRPVAVVAVPGADGALAVVEQGGTVRLLDESGRPRGAPLLDLRGLVLTSPKGAYASEQGLLSVAYLADGRLAAAYTRRDGALVVEAFPLVSGRASLAAGEELLAVAKRASGHYGGQLAVGPDGHLYLGVGDDEEPANAQAAGPGNPHGKILRLRDGRWETFALGLRNPWRFSFAPDGALWVGDVGALRWEEVTRVPVEDSVPANLGWGAFEGGEATGRSSAAEPDELTWPLAVYGHETGCAVIGGAVARDPSLPGLEGRYVYGDYCTGAVWSLDPANPGDVRLELALGATLASFGEDGRGRLLLVSRTGRIFRLELS